MIIGYRAVTKLQHFRDTAVELREPELEAIKVGSPQFLPVAKNERRKPIKLVEKVSKTETDAFTAKIFPENRFGTMRHCILEALNKQLVGGEGHLMRLAIVGEALAAGKNRDEIIQMFKRQNDFDEATTNKHIGYLIEKGYKPWKCETIEEKCSSFVDCVNCPRNKLKLPEELEESAIAG